LDAALLIALYTLLHILIFVYWLGGDLGVFYSSTILTDTKTSPAGRIAAAKVLAQVDMAPRTAMILTLPTGLTLADARTWIELSGYQITGVWLLALAWLALAWIVHIKHLPAGAFIRKLDLAIRWALIVALLAWAGIGALPLFIKIKLVIIAMTIGLGLWIRKSLGPFGPAFMEMVSSGPTSQTDATIAASLNQSRPAVISIWILLLAAAFLGLYQPT
jgi:hypothetical protein